jgi:protein O-mannosyl-transferase
MARLRLIGSLLALITLLAYLPVGSYGYVNYDDNDYVTENYIVQSGLTWTGVKWAFTTWHTGNWHPLTWLSLMTGCQLFGLNPGAEHLVNVMFHMANAVLLLWLVFRLTGALWPSAFVAALFAWHPLHVESVAWISERKDVLSTFFEMLALLAYTRYAQRQSRVEDQGPGLIPTLNSRLSTLDYSLALIFFALALLAKPTPVTLPFVMLLLDYWPLNRVASCGPKVEGKSAGFQSATFNLRLVTEKWPFFLLAAASCVVTFLAQHAPSVLSLGRYPLYLRLGNAPLSCVRYLWKTIWPAKLAVIYPLQNHLPWLAVAAAAVLLIAVTWFVWRLRRTHPYLLVGWIWYLGTLVPVIGLVQAGLQAMADRYTYVPLIGVFLAFAFGIKDLIARFHVGIAPTAATAGLILASCLAFTEHQLGYWRNSEMLFSHALAVTKNNDIARINLGVALEKQGQRAAALTNYLAALSINPHSVQAHNNLGDILDETGKPLEALAQYQEALRLNPNTPLAHDNLGTVLVELGRFDEAMSQYQAAARLAPRDPRTYYLMGKALLKQGRNPEAIARFRSALRINPDDFQSLTVLARVLASDQDPKIRNGPEAVALAGKANALTGGTQPLVLDALAMACAEAGRFSEARQIEQHAVELAEASGLKETNELKARLELFENHRPYRESFLPKKQVMPAPRRE